ncbi:hypothetical protein PK98_06160 [Croceibacterium mercuriale]|uniref:DUF192 domain-containing protein n=1 Tax=Croceibacterium mercuriale TaxID=1572751 RepID=A0A0B2C1Q3_9SPHN|nr:DUF192 domain-containing protein [Croceibacterium mercuriale]KHL26105.1 hypothetical protein PK98_06160 [Croceibacterium mercuriale]
MRLATLLLSLMSATALVACAPQDSGATATTQAPAAHPVSGLRVIPLTVQTGGTTHRFRVEVAESAEAQARGLMFRTEMGADEGMIFPYAAPQQLSFWMRNTVLPLDLVFIGADKRVINVSANAVPYSEAQLMSDGPAIAVLELNGGRAAQLGIGPGAVVSW